MSSQKYILKFLCLDAGSDVAGLRTTAELTDNNFILNGVKSWVTSGPQGKAAIVFATIDKAIKYKGNHYHLDIRWITFLKAF